jgi:hypothetical protein
MQHFRIVRTEAREMNRWLTKVHYLHRPVVNSKLLAHAIVDDNNVLLGGILWATPHFTKKQGLFGYVGTPDKWEVLMLARFYLIEDSGVTASAALSDSIGIAGKRRGSRKRGWRLQADWTFRHPPVFPTDPYVTRLIVSWSDKSLAHVQQCVVCGQTHNGAHDGTIYKASGWTHNGVTTRGGRRNQDGLARGEVERHEWIMRFPPNVRADTIGLKRYNTIVRNDKEAARRISVDYTHAGVSPLVRWEQLATGVTVQ